MVTLRSFLRNLFVFPPKTRRIFSDAVMNRIENAIAQAEAQQGCEIRFVIEGAIPLGYLRRKNPLQERGNDLFSQLRVWDTENNNGILFYLVLSENAFHLIPDRAAQKLLTPAEWQEISNSIQQHLAISAYEDAVIYGIQLLSEKLHPHFPTPVKQSELSNQPEVI